MKGYPLRLIWIFLISLAFLFLPFSLKASPVQNLDFPRLIETREVFSMLGNPSVRVIDLRTSLLDYLKGHIPNAVYFDVKNLQVPRNGIPAQAPDRISLEKIIGDYLGVSNDMWIVLYSEKSNANATFLAWTLDFLGHKRFGVLNGGWEKWVLEKLPTTQTYPATTLKKFFGKAKSDSLAEKRWVYDHLSTRGAFIADARSPRQYTGEEGDEIRKGHIPGAKNIFWETVLEGEEGKVWRKREDLERLMADSGISRQQEVVVYCRTGREASHLYFTLKFVLGFPKVRLYRGSWIEWSADEKMPVKLGSDP